MKGGFVRLITDYQESVARAVGLLEASGYARPSSSAEWASNGMPARGTLPGGFKYYKHGSGCAVTARDWSVDFDFGDRGEIDGFSADRLHHFAGSRLASYGFTSLEEVERAIADAAASGALVFSGNILYYLAADRAP
jgi:hypothetical protein